MQKEESLDVDLFWELIVSLSKKQENNNTLLEMRRRNLGSVFRGHPFFGGVHLRAPLSGGVFKGKQPGHPLVCCLCCTIMSMCAGGPRKRHTHIVQPSPTVATPTPGSQRCLSQSRNKLKMLPNVDLEKTKCILTFGLSRQPGSPKV